MTDLGMVPGSIQTTVFSNIRTLGDVDIDGTLTVETLSADTFTGASLDSGGAVYNVRAFGAVGDGSTDDTTSIRSTVAALPTTGGTVFFPPGAYSITSTIDLGTKAIAIVGAGAAGSGPSLDWGASRIVATGAFPTFEWGVSDAQGSFEGPVFRDLQIVSNGSGTTAIHLLAPATFLIDNVSIASFASGCGIHLDATNAAQDLTAYGSIRETRILFCKIGIDGEHMNGVHVNAGWISPTGNNTTTSPEADTWGIRIQSGDAWCINGTRIQYADRGIDLQGSSTAQHSIIGTRTEGCNTHIRVACNRNLIIPGSMSGGNVGADDVGVLFTSAGGRNTLLVGGASGISSVISDLGGSNTYFNNQDPTPTGASAAGFPRMADGFIEGAERSDPGTPAANTGRIYFKDNGLGNTAVAFRLATGSPQYLSTRTIAASALTASAANGVLVANEIVFAIGGASGASLLIHSGGTVYGFNSAFSAAAT